MPHKIHLTWGFKPAIHVTAQHVVIMLMLSQTADQRSTCVKSQSEAKNKAMTRRSKQISEAWCLPLTRQPMELFLKSPSSPCIFSPFSSRSIQQWDAEFPLFSFADSEIDAKGQGTKVSFKSQTPAIYISHKFLLQSYYRVY